MYILRNRFGIFCRHQAECEELQVKVENLSNENRSLRDELQKLSEECEKLTSENSSIKVSLILFFFFKHNFNHIIFLCNLIQLLLHTYPDSGARKLDQIIKTN